MLSYIIGFAIAAAFVGAGYSVYKQKKAGGCCGCEGCGNSACPNSHADEKHTDKNTDKHIKKLSRI